MSSYSLSLIYVCILNGVEAEGADNPKFHGCNEGEPREKKIKVCVYLAWRSIQTSSPDASPQALASYRFTSMCCERYLLAYEGRSSGAERATGSRNISTA